MREVKVVLRTAGAEQAWLVMINPSASLEQLLPELVETLPFQGKPEDFDLAWEGSLEDLSLVISQRHVRAVGGYKPIT